MKTLINKNDLIIQQTDVRYSKKYEIEIVQKTVSESDISENTTSFVVEKTLIKTDHIGFLYTLKITERKQSNYEELRAMEDYLSFLQKEIILYTDKLGHLKSIVNLREIEEEWTLCRSEFRKKFKKTPNIDEIVERLNLLFKDMESFTLLFSQSELASLLFPPIYTELLTAKSHLLQQKNFDDFFGAYTLPLLLKTEVIKLPTKDNQALKISREGTINNHLLKEDEIKQFFRDLYQSYSLIVDLNINYIELFDLDINNTIDYSMQIFSVKVGSIYSFEQFSKVVTIKE